MGRSAGPRPASGRDASARRRAPSSLTAFSFEASEALGRALAGWALSAELSGGALRSRRGSRGHARFSSSPSYRWEKRGKGEPRDLPSSGAANEEQGWEWDPGSRRGRREGHAKGGAAVSLLREGERIRLEETGTCQVVLDRTKR